MTFWGSLALPKAGQRPCERREITVSTNEGFMLMQFFTLGSSKTEISETYFLS